MLQKAIFNFAVQEKRLKKQYFGAKYNFFRKRCSLHSPTFLSLFQTCWDTLSDPTRRDSCISMSRFLVETKNRNNTLIIHPLMMTKDQLLLYWCNLELKSNSTKDGCNFNSQRICYLIYFSVYRELWNCWLYWGHKMRGPKSQQDVFRLALNRDLFKIPKKVV